MAQIAVTVVVTLVGVLGFVCVLLMASVGTVLRLGEPDADARPLLARRHPAAVPHSAAGVDAVPAPAEPVAVGDAPVPAVVAALPEHERTAA